MNTLFYNTKSMKTSKFIKVYALQRWGGETGAAVAAGRS